MKRALWALTCIGALTSCGPRATNPGVPGSYPGTANPQSCFATKIDPANVRATITFYGWPDNSPPGNQIAHPVVHQHAGGDGTYCDPTTFATERANNKTIPYGIKIYVPFIKQYFVREDLCAASGPHSGSGSQGCRKLWFDLWVGGTAKSKSHDVIACERKLTPGAGVRVVLWPKDGMPVAHAGPLYRNQPSPDGSCDGRPER